MCSAFKAAGMPPTAGLLYALATAYYRHVGCYPFGINLQASLQTLGFVPVIQERYFIGDWLIGPCYKVRVFLAAKVRDECSRAWNRMGAGWKRTAPNGSRVEAVQSVLEPNGGRVEPNESSMSCH